jgi:hypothetical protein
MATHLFSSAGGAGLSCFVQGQPVRVIPWDQIQDIGAFHRKDDRSEYAVVWLRVPSDMLPVEFTERDPQWADLLHGFSQHLRGVIPFERWFPEEMHPVFEQNTYGVYSKNA